ncbi:MAG: hypothetical protein KF775_00935 [Cyclobacteriaceae bacterium]|nr:hypothetical protein [Cyclobacteriaceae bacterium]
MNGKSNMVRFWFFFLIIFISSGVQCQSIDEVINKFYNSTGGKENWESLNGYKTIYTYREKGTKYVEESLLEYPNKIASSRRAKNGEHYSYVINNDAGYEIVNNERKDFKDGLLTEKKKAAYFLPFLYYKDFDLDLENLGLKPPPMIEGFNFTSFNKCVAIQRNFENKKYYLLL